MSSLYLLWRSPVAACLLIFITLGGQGLLAEEKSPEDKSLKAKCQLAIPSTRRLFEEAGATQLGRVYQHFRQIDQMTRADRREDGDEELGVGLAPFFAQLAHWPDMGLQLAVYPPDVAGRPKWVVQISLPVEQVHDLMADLIEGEGERARFFEGLAERSDGDEFVYSAGDRSVAFLRAADEDYCLLRSHQDVTMPDKIFRGAPRFDTPVIACRLELQGTEEDSGATFLSSFRLVTFVDYTTRISEDGVWEDKVRAGWPMISWLTLKALIGQPRQTFFVPQDAFLGAVTEINGATVGLDQALGLKTKANVSPGPVQQYGEGEVLFTLLPGIGFLPAPEIVAQCRLSDSEAFLDDLGSRVDSINRQLKKKDQGEPWHKMEIEGHTVIWSDLSQQGKGRIVPFKMRPVIFVQEAEDANDRVHDFLVAGWTTTNPRKFVERWLERERGADTSRFLPESRSNNLEAWIHWQELYDWIHPYVNLSLNEISEDAILTDDLVGQLPDGRLSGQIKMGGLIIDHEGPVPLGVMAIPAMLSASLQETKNSNVARERLARRHLKVLYHHATLFRKDTGRWPVSVAELDGYVDFAANRRLLELRQSSKKRFGKLLSQLFGDDDDEEESDSDDGEELYDVDDSIYEVVWVDDEWQMGFAEGELEHLEHLYIDANGEIHRVEKIQGADEATADAS